MTKKEFQLKEKELNFLVKTKQEAVDAAKAANKISKNSLTDEQVAKAEAALAEAQQILDEFKAAEQEISDEELFGTLEEKFKGMLEANNAKFKDVKIIANLKAEEYLNSKQADHDFAEAIRNHISDKEGMLREWANNLKARGIVSENAITGTLPLPKTAVTAWQDAWLDKSNWINKLNTTEFKRISVPVNTTDQNAEGAQALGHTPGEQKTEQTWAADEVEISCELVYVINSLNEIDSYNDDTAVIKYIMKESAMQLHNKIAQCILVGDGRVDNKHIKKIVPIYRTSDPIKSVTTVKYDDTLSKIKQLRAMRRAIKTQGDEKVLLFLSPEMLDDTCEVTFSDGGTIQYLEDDKLARQVRVSEVIVTDFLGAESVKPEVKAIMVRADKYMTTGRFNPELYQWRDMFSNKTYWRTETPYGGNLIAPKCAAVLKDEALA